MKTVINPTLKMTLTDFVISGSTSARPPSRQKLLELPHLQGANRDLIEFKGARDRQRKGTIMRLKRASSHAFKQQMPSAAMQSTRSPAIRHADKLLMKSATKKENSARIPAFDKADQ